MMYWCSVWCLNLRCGKKSIFKRSIVLLCYIRFCLFRGYWFICINDGFFAFVCCVGKVDINLRVYIYLRKKILLFCWFKPYSLIARAIRRIWIGIKPSSNVINSGYHEKKSMFLNKRYYSTKRNFKCNNDSNKEGKINLITIFYLIDIRKLYLIKKDIIKNIA